MSLKRFITDDKPILKLGAADSVKDAIKQMTDEKVDAVLIMNDGNSLEGIFTKNDVMTKVVAEERNIDQTTLGDVMTKDVVVLSSGTTVDHAINVMGKNGIRHLPVEDKDHAIIGVIPLRRLLYEKIKMVVDDLHTLEAYQNDSLGG